MSHPVFQLFRVLHVVVGAFWLGALLFLVIFLMPALRAIGPASGLVMNQIANVRRLPLYMMMVPILSLLTGLGLMWHDSSITQGAWMRTAAGQTFSSGAAVAIVAMFLGMGINAPTGRRLGKMAASFAGSPPSPEMQVEVARLQNRLYRSTQICAVLVLLSTGLMAIARYV